MFYENGLACCDDPQCTAPHLLPLPGCGSCRLPLPPCPRVFLLLLHPRRLPLGPPLCRRRCHRPRRRRGRPLHRHPRGGGGGGQPGVDHAPRPAYGGGREGGRNKVRQGQTKLYHLCASPSLPPIVVGHTRLKVWHSHSLDFSCLWLSIPCAFAMTRTRKSFRFPAPDKVFPLDFIDHGRRLPEHEVDHQHAGHLLLDL